MSSSSVMLHSSERVEEICVQSSSPTLHLPQLRLSSSNLPTNNHSTSSRNSSDLSTTQQKQLRSSSDLTTQQQRSSAGHALQQQRSSGDHASQQQRSSGNSASQQQRSSGDHAPQQQQKQQLQSSGRLVQVTGVRAREERNESEISEGLCDDVFESPVIINNNHQPQLNARRVNGFSKSVSHQYTENNMNSVRTDSEGRACVKSISKSSAHIRLQQQNDVRMISSVVTVECNDTETSCSGLGKDIQCGGLGHYVSCEGQSKDMSCSGVGRDSLSSGLGQGMPCGGLGHSPPASPLHEMRGDREGSRSASRSSERAGGITGGHRGLGSSSGEDDGMWSPASRGDGIRDVSGEQSPASRVVLVAEIHSQPSSLSNGSMNPQYGDSEDHLIQEKMSDCTTESPGHRDSRAYSDTSSPLPVEHTERKQSNKPDSPSAKNESLVLGSEIRSELGSDKSDIKPAFSHGKLVRIDHVSESSAPDDDFDTCQSPHETSRSPTPPALEASRSPTPPALELAADHASSSSSSQVIPGSGTDGRLVVVAIDFGTTFSGYAFSFVHDKMRSVYVMRKWEGGDPGINNQKTPTVLLLNPAGEFHSFGFTARDYYHDLSAAEAKKWFYFDKFKMALHYTTDLNKDTTVQAANGKPYSALKVFSHALRYFKDRVLQELTDQSETEVSVSDIRWVVTVPAIWKQPAKQFMRQAAYEAGLASDDSASQLLIGLEPEVASVYVRQLRLYQLNDESPMRPRSASRSQLYTDNEPPPPDSYNTFPSKSSRRATLTGCQTVGRVTSARQLTVGHHINVQGLVYMIVDCGGGTVDITVHQMDSSYRAGLKEVYKATGGPYGSAGVDGEFERLMSDIFGADMMRSFHMKRPSGWVDLMMAFESRKRAASPSKNAPLNISLPFSFIDYYKKHSSSTVEAAIRKYGDEGVRWSSQGMMRISPQIMKQLFSSTVTGICQAIGDVLNAPNVKSKRVLPSIAKYMMRKWALNLILFEFTFLTLADMAYETEDVQYMFVVGGFAESSILQTELRKEFGNILKVLIPQEVSLVVLKGAVLFGLDPSIVEVRRSRLTYGLGVLNRYDPAKHPLTKLWRRDGVDWCTDVLDKIVVIDQPIALGDTVIRSYTPAKSGQRSILVHVYCSERPDVTFTSDPGVKRCGTLCLDLSDILYRSQEEHQSTNKVSTNRRREIQARLTFGDTEIHVSAVDVSSGKCVKASIDFLNK